ncbi:metallophosphoesterase [Flavobacteriaceae bacterium LMO-SS05]
MKQVIKLLPLFLILYIVQSCATYDGQIEAVSQPAQNTSGINIFLIGDAGKLENNQPSKTLKALNENIKSSKKDDVLLFLGDNIYPEGIPNINKDEALAALQSQMDVARNFKGKVIFVPGNHDWYSGIDGLKAQENLVEDALGKKSFSPQNACPLESFDVSDDIVVITVDSEWYLTNWDKHPKMNDGCDMKSREKFIAEFKSLVNKNQGKTIVLAMHHPLESNGSHGGQFPFNPLKAPLNVLRNASGISPADLNFPRYRELSNKITTILQEYKNNVIVVSGHEHNLQYLVHNNIPQIISGSGSKVNPVRHYQKDDSSFSYGGLGFAVLNIQENHQTVHYYDETNQLIHSKVIRETQKEQPFSISGFPKEKSITASIYNKHIDDKSKAYNSFFGNHYRQLYYNKYNFQIVNLDTLFGGLNPVKLGGGNQTVSLRLEDKDGKEYVMRRMRKSATQFIQVKAFQEDYMKDRLENTVTERFIMDFYTTSYPFGALLNGGLSDIVGVYHTNPQLYYVPKQQALGNYNDYLGDGLYLIEERVSKEFKSQASFGNADDIVSTDEVIEKITKDEKYNINHQQYIKTRLFDMWLGDWDRHEDQYRWASYTNQNGTITFAPIPRDRDQAFPKFDGALTVAITRLIPSLRLMQSYGDDIRNVNNFNQIIYKVDKILINKSSLNEWLDQAKFLQEQLTNEAIDQAVLDFPSQFKDQNFKEIIKHLKNRRTHIVEWAETYYTTLNRNVILQGTNKDDLFEITRLENGLTQVKITRIKNTISEQDVMFDKIFDPNITNEIWLYGLDDKDQFRVSGTHNSKIKIRLIGGQNKDSYSIENKKNIKVYDYKSKESVFEGENVFKRLSDEYEPNNYDFNKFKHNLRQVLPTFGYNPDEGLTIGASTIFTKYGFELNPFTQKHSIEAKYFSATSGYEVGYTGEIARIFGKSNLRIETRYSTPAFAQNFFGFGNETENLEDDLDIEFYRTRLEQFNFKALFVKRGHLGSEFTVGIPFEYIKPNDNENRFVEQNLTIEDQEAKQFLGVETAYSFINKNNKSFSTLGIEFSVQAGWKTNLETSNQNFAYLTSAFQLDYPVLKDDRLTLSTIWKGHIISNQNFEFYQAASIGGKNGLRGFRNERFSGQSSYYQNTDLRLHIMRFNAGILPAKLGAFTGFDYGRVWLKNDDSNKWHTAYGGGLYVNTAGLFTFQTSYFSSDDGGRFMFGLGFGF